jgi:UDP-2,3-diacylglucosamine hydrolase
MIYFASDFHLGMGINADERERKICRWLDFVSEDASDIFLLGDLFDFWFEYKKAVPKGFVRFLGKLAELTDKGIRIHVCVGNHDLWMRDYLEKECGVRIFREPEVHEFSGRTFVLHHGDGLGPGDEKYKLLKRIFTNKLAQGFFGMLHPDLGIRLASGWSKKSRLNQPKWEETFQGNDKEYLVQFCEYWVSGAGFRGSGVRPQTSGHRPSTIYHLPSTIYHLPSTTDHLHNLPIPSTANGRSLAPDFSIRKFMY